MLSNQHWLVTRILTTGILRSLDGFPDLRNFPDPAAVNDWEDIMHEIISLSVEIDLSEALQLTHQALALTVESLIAAHRAAGLVRVPFPDEQTIAILQNDLAFINKSVAKDQGFAVAVEFAGVAAKLIQKSKI